MAQEKTRADAEIHTILHRLRNAINVVVTSARCLQTGQELDAESAAFAASMDRGADDARALLARLQTLTDERAS